MARIASARGSDFGCLDGVSWDIGVDIIAVWIAGERARLVLLQHLAQVVCREWPLDVRNGKEIVKAGRVAVALVELANTFERRRNDRFGATASLLIKRLLRAETRVTLFADQVAVIDLARKRRWAENIALPAIFQLKQAAALAAGREILDLVMTVVVGPLNRDQRARNEIFGEEVVQTENETTPVRRRIPQLD